MNLETPVSAIEFVAFDFETTGLHSATDRIVEFGAVRFGGTGIIAEFNQLSNPGIPISADAAAISGIRDPDVAHAPPEGNVLPDFLRFLGGSVLVAHNAPFDMGFLRAAVQRLQAPAVENLVIDTQLLAMKAWPRKRSYALQNLAAELNLPRGAAHRARDDAELCMRLFLAAVRDMSFMGELALSEVLTTPPAGQGRNSGGITS